MVNVLTGPNTFLLQQHLRQIISDFVTEHGDLALERLDGEEASLDRITESLQSLPFLASHKLVVLTKPGANKVFGERIDELVQGVPETTDVIIVEPKLDKRLSYYKTLRSQPGFKEFNELDANGLANWLVKTVTEQGGNMNFSDTRYLVERVGANQQLLWHELQKLLTYQPQINRQTIDLLSEPVPQSTIFELLDAAFAGRLPELTKLYQEQRALKVEPQQIMGLIAWQLHVLAVVKTAGDKSAEDIARQARLNPFVVRKTQSIARQLDLKQVKELIHQALVLDIRLKTESIDADEALQHFLFSLGQTIS